MWLGLSLRESWGRYGFGASVTVGCDLAAMVQKYLVSGLTFGAVKG